MYYLDSYSSVILGQNVEVYADVCDFFANTVVYAEISYRYVKRKMYLLRACCYMLSNGATRDSHESLLCMLKNVWRMPTCVH